MSFNVHSLVGDELFGGGENILYLCDYEKGNMGIS